MDSSSSSLSSREMSPEPHLRRYIATSPFHEFADPPRRYHPGGDGGLQLSCGYSGYIMPLIGVGLGAGYGTYKIFGRFKDEPVSETNTSIKTPAPTPTPTIYRIMRNRRYHPKGDGGLQQSCGYRGPPKK